MTKTTMDLSELLEKHDEGDFLRTVAEAVLQLIMETDVEGVIGAGRHERAEGRVTYRNGYRRRILIQLNRHEGRHRLARTVFHGKRGELTQRYREGQEDQLGAPGLVVNIVVLWNTIYKDAALEQLRAEGYEVRLEDVAHLSSLGYTHVNMLGRYAFTLPDTVARGELRPLRDPRAVGPDDP